MKRYIHIIIVFTSYSLLGYNPQQIKNLKISIAHGNEIIASGADFRGAGALLAGINFSSAQLSGTYFDVISILSGASFLIEILGQVTNLTGANFSNAILVSSSFKGAILKKAIFTNADIGYANFTDADLTGAFLDGALNIETAVFAGATMPDGKKCLGVGWKSLSGKIINCYCA